MGDSSVLMESLRKLSDIENSRCVISIALFDKKVKRVKQKKMDIIRAELESKVYSAKKDKLSKTDSHIEEIISGFEGAIDSLINIYYEQQLRLQEHLQKIETEQKYVINDLLKAYLSYKQNPTEDNKATVHALAQKKVNYDVLIDECEGRIEVNIDEAETAVDGLIEDKTVKIATIEKENFITRFSKIIKTFFTKPAQSITNKFADTEEKLEKVESFSNRKVKRVKYEILYFDEQINQALSMA